MNAKKIVCTLHRFIGAMRLYAPAFGSVTTLLQPDTTSNLELMATALHLYL